MPTIFTLIPAERAEFATLENDADVKAFCLLGDKHNMFVQTWLFEATREQFMYNRAQIALRGMGKLVSDKVHRFQTLRLKAMGY